MNNSLNKKWWVPREENLGRKGDTSKKAFKVKLVKDVLIYIKDNFKQLPGGCVDLNAITINIDDDWDKALNKLESIAVLFDLRLDVATGYTTMFFDVIESKDVLDDASVVTIESIGLYAKILVKTFHGDIIYYDECIELDNDLYPDHPYALEDECIYSEYYDSYILSNHSSEVISNNLVFHNDSQPDTVHYSEWNDGFVDLDDDYVYHGYINSSGDRGYFYDDDCVYCDYTQEYYADAVVALDVDGVAWCEHAQEYTNKPRNKNAGYRELERIMKLTPNTEFGIGFEIEKEDCDAWDIEWEPLYGKTGWAKEDDSSLDDDRGYELVSPAFDLHTDDLDKAIEESDDLKTLINAKFSNNCGGHLTVSSSLYSAHEMLEGLSAFFPLLYALYDGRTENDYSKPKLKWEYHDGGRSRGAINSRGNRSIAQADHKTFGAIEMRIFSAVRSVKNLMWRRDLVRIMVENFGKSEREVLRLLMNPKSKLLKHLLKVYTIQRIVKKITLYVYLSKEYNHKVLQMPDSTELLEKLRNQLINNNDSTNELGA